ncbi:MAG: substrate-binding domain-containing protein [Lachnospiraceae bacterium]|nr:substrate-binding domain-containing protein [Lachnospiraceae bacterium]
MQVTLKDIAEKLGVTVTTVHKALNGSTGVSEKRRTEILQTAAEMGYKVNYMASSLSRREFRIAAVLPDTVGDNRFYYGALWDGMRSFLQTIQEYPVEVTEYPYPLTPDGNGRMLGKLFRQDSDRFHGLITIAMDSDCSAHYLEQFARKRIPVVLIGADLHTDSRLCCVKADDTMAGQLAAELLTAFLPHSTPVTIITAGDPGMRDQLHNIRAFHSYLKQYAPLVNAVSLEGTDPESIITDIRRYLAEHPDVYAIYTSSSRFTFHLGKCIRELGLQDRIPVIGNDLFPESRQALADGILRGVIDKKIPQQGSLALQTLVEYLFKKERPHSDILTVRPEVVLRSSFRISPDKNSV